MKILLSPLFLFLSVLSLSAQNLQPLESIYFQTGSAALDATALNTLEKVAEQILAYPDYRLQVAAHTDSRGSSDYNLKLAQDRATTVSDWLRSQGLDTDQFQVQALGETKAGSDQGSTERQSRNRRVDLSFEGWGWTDLATLQDSLSLSLEQSITINAGQDASWSGKTGGQFYLPAGSLVDPAGNPVTGPVNINLIEAYTLSDMLKAGLTTLAPEGILQTGGMLYWDAQQNGQSLSLAPGAELNVSVPTDNFMEDMNLFYGQGHSDTPPSSWEDSGEAITSKLPLLRLADAPKRPAHTHYIQKFLKIERPPVTEDPRYPLAPTMTRPRQPHEPVYERIAYRPTGIEKLTMSKQKRAELTEALREGKRQDYEERLAKYEASKPVYDALMQDYRQRCETFEAKWANEVDPDGNLRPVHPSFSTLQAQADSVFAEHIAKYQRDSSAYETYRARKIADYEQRMEAFELQGITNQTSLQTYLLGVNRMGWANIDRFIKLNPVTPILAFEPYSGDGPEAMVFILFPERNIILRMPRGGAAQYVLDRVPVGENAKLIAVKIVDQRAYLAQDQFVISPESKIELEFTPTRLKDIRLAMEDI